MARRLDAAFPSPASCARGRVDAASAERIIVDLVDAIPGSLQNYEPAGRSTQLLPLNRATYASRESAPLVLPRVRIVHLGLGAFPPGTPGWFTAKVDDDAEWGIAAFTGRNPKAAEELSRQDGLFTLIERSELATPPPSSAASSKRSMAPTWPGSLPCWRAAYGHRDADDYERIPAHAGG
jgi:hypothetical protein